MIIRGFVSAGLLAISSVPYSSGTLLYASSYIGTVTTLNLTVAQESGSHSHCKRGHRKRTTAAVEAKLDVLSVTDACAPNPTWLTLDRPNGIVYCLDEGLATVNGTLSAFQTDEDGTLVLLDKIDTINGPVSSVIYGDNGSGLALAQYIGSSLSAVNIADPAGLEVVQTETFSMDGKGPVPTRQDSPHPHEALLDPTNQFILLPDLGADLVRIFKYDPSTLGFTAAEPLVAAPGSGPRHAAFFVTEDTTFMYLVGEISNVLTIYEVTYDDEATGMEFREVDVIGSHGEGIEVPERTTSAEAHISPDNKFLLISTRYDGSFMIPSHNDTEVEVESDSIVSFAIDAETGGLSLAQHVACGGRVPRQFAMNKAGDLLAVGLQGDGRVAILPRDPDTGEIGGTIASAEVEGPVTCAIFDE